MPGAREILIRVIFKQPSETQLLQSTVADALEEHAKWLREHEAKGEGKMVTKNGVIVAWEKVI